MNVLIIGQCQGGNAKSWQDFLMSYTGFDLVHYVCRDQCQQDFFLKGEGQKVFRFTIALPVWAFCEKYG